MAEAKGYQPEKAIVCIRDPDGYLCMGNTLAINQSMGRLRPYHGKMDASLEERLAYLRGPDQKDVQAKIAVEIGRVDLDAMDRDALIEYAMDEYALKITRKNMSDQEIRKAIREAKALADAPKPQATGIGGIAAQA
jgi:hypothetical protein